MMDRAKTGLRRLYGGVGGAVAIELAIGGLLFLVLLTGVIEVGVGAYQAMQVQDAAEAGALYATKHGWNPAGITAAIVNATGATGVTATPVPRLFCGCPSAAGIAPVDCASVCPDGTPPGQYAQISAAIPHQAILPYVSLPTSFAGKSIVRLK